MIWPNLKQWLHADSASFLNLGPSDVEHRDAETFLPQEWLIHNVIKHFEKQMEMPKYIEPENICFMNIKKTLKMNNMQLSKLIELYVIKKKKKQTVA